MKLRQRNQPFIRFKHLLYELLAFFQFTMMNKNIDLSFGRNAWLNFLIIIKSVQELQLVNEDKVYVLRINFFSLFKEFSSKYQVNLIIYNDSGNFLILSYIIILGQYLYFAYLKIFVQYQISIHHSLFFIITQTAYYIFSIPIFFNLIQRIICNNEYGHVGVVIALAILNFLYIFFNCQKSFFEITGNYTILSEEIFYYLTTLLLCMMKIKYQIGNIQLSIILLQNVVLIFCQSKDNGQNKEFVQNTKISKLIFSLAEFSNMQWIDMLILFIFIQKTIQAFQEREKSRFLININQEKNPKILIEAFAQQYQDPNPIKTVLIEKQLQLSKKEFDSKIKTINLKDRILIEMYLDGNFFKLHLILIKLQLAKLAVLDQIFVKANINFIKQYYTQRIHHNIFDCQILVKILKTEQKHSKIFIQIAEIRQTFFHTLIKNIDGRQNFQLIFDNCIKYCSQMQELKRKLEQSIDFQNLTIKNCPHSDSITLLAIQNYYKVFYLNNSKADIIAGKLKDLTNWNSLLNVKLKNNQILLFQVSYLKQPGRIINQNQKQVLFFGNKKIEIFLMLIPKQFQKGFQTLVENFISKGFITNEIRSLFICQKQFIIPCKISLYHEMINDDLIINKVVEIENDQHFLLFDSTGSIFGITKELFLFLNQENDYIDEFECLQYFLENGKIYNYILDAEQQTQILNSKQNKFKIQFKSYWNTSLNLCIDHQQILNNSKGTKIERLQQSKLNTVPSQGYECSNQYYSDNTLQNYEQYSDDKMPFEFEMELKEQDEFFGQYYILRFMRLNNLTEMNNDSNILKIYATQIRNTSETHPSNILIEQSLQKRKLSKNLLLQLLVMILLTIFALLTSVINNINSESEITSYQNSINILINPQALTFSYAGSYLLQWNNYCSQNGLYTLSKYVEFQRQQKLKYAFTLWNGIHINYTLNLSKKSLELGLSQVQVIDFDKNDNQILTLMDYYSFYSITREKMVRVFKNSNFSNLSSTADYSIFRANGFIRQNILTIFKYHDIVMNNEINFLVTKIRFSQDKFLMIVLLEIALFALLIVFLMRLIISLNNLLNEIFALLSYINIVTIKNEIVSTQYGYQTNHPNVSLPSQEPKFSNSDNEKEGQPVQKSSNLLTKLNNYVPFKKWRILIPFIFLILYVALMSGIFYYRNIYYSRYADSLQMTMKYIRFKKLFDSSILLGELIKTEHLIPGNPYHLVNQTETTISFLQYADNATQSFSEILDDLIVSDYFNQTMKNLILSAFGQNLCINFKKFLVFCNTSNILLPYKPDDTYAGLIQDGIGGVMQNYKKIIQQEFSTERQTSTYEFNQTHSKQYLNSQLHQNFFIQYAEDIQSCFFTCFSYFINESIHLGQLFISVISNYYLITTTMQITLQLFRLIIVYIVVAIYWVYSQYDMIHKLKYILTLLNPKLVQSKLIYPKLVNIQKLI